MRELIEADDAEKLAKALERPQAVLVKNRAAPLSRITDFDSHLLAEDCERGLDLLRLGNRLFYKAACSGSSMRRITRSWSPRRRARSELLTRCSRMAR